MDPVDEKTIKLKQMKIIKMGKKHIIIIPQAFIKHKMINPDLEYDVELEIHQPDE